MNTHVRDDLSYLQGVLEGAWTTPAFNAGHFTANTGSWTVDSGDVGTMAYHLTGKTVTVVWNIAATTVSSTPASLQITNGQWGGGTAAKTVYNMAMYNDNGGGNTVGYAAVVAADTKIVINKLTGNFAAATNTTNVFGQITFEIT